MEGQILVRRAQGTTGSSFMSMGKVWPMRRLKLQTPSITCHDLLCRWPPQFRDSHLHGGSMDVKRQHIVKSVMLFRRPWREQLVKVSDLRFSEHVKSQQLGLIVCFVWSEPLLLGYFTPLLFCRYRRSDIFRPRLSMYQAVIGFDARAFMVPLLLLILPSNASYITKSALIVLLVILCARYDTDEVAWNPVARERL